jgi:selenocysteine lyase/cysteine desulfurase
MFDAQKLREEEFPYSLNQHFFNSASISLLPRRVQRQMTLSGERLMDDPFSHWRDEIMPMFTQMNESIARLINAAKTEEIAPITSTSYGMNALAQSIPWQAGDNVVLCNVEFPANVYPWMSLARDGVEARLIPARNGGLTVDALAEAVDKRTRVVTVSLLQFFTGHRSDLMALGKFCHERGIMFVVDAIQAVGHIPLDVQAMHIDALVTGGQKSLMAAPGTGFMYVRDEVCETLRPRFIGGNGTKDYLFWLDYDLTPLPGPARFGMGTPNMLGLVGMAKSVELLGELGIPAIDEHTSAVARCAMDMLERQGYEVITPRDAHGSIVTFVSGRDSLATDTFINDLKAHQITAVKHLDRAGKAYVRFSFHCYNTIEEIAQVEPILQKLR